MVADLPPVLRRKAAEGVPALPTNCSVLFTLHLDGPRATEVMPIPGPEDLIFGTVKTYSFNSGYGFIEPVEDSFFTHDVYFHHRDLPPASGDSMRMRLQGATCGFHIRLTPDGKAQAKNIDLISRLEEDPEVPAASCTGQNLHGVIRTFRQSSGYGFLSCPDLGRDVWFARRELAGELLKAPLPGVPVVFELWVTHDEKPQARALRPGDAPTTDVSLKRSAEGSEPDAKRPHIVLPPRPTMPL